MNTHEPNNESKFTGPVELTCELLGQIEIDGLIELIGMIVGAFSDC